jgi:hypothetical protein
MSHSPTYQPQNPEDAARESAIATLGDLCRLASQIPGVAATLEHAATADVLAEELSELGARLRALPDRPPEMPGYARMALAALRSAHAAGEDIGEFLAQALARLAAELGSSADVVSNRPGSWESGLVAALLSGTVGESDEFLGSFGATS